MSRTSTIKDIQQIAANTPVGQESREICPACEGGSTRERSLSVRRSSDTTANFVCYRASCDLGKGAVACHVQDGKVLNWKSKPVTKNKREPELFSLSQDSVDLMMDKYQMTEDHIRYAGVKLTKDKRLAFPINGPNRERPGILIKKEPKLYCGIREYSSIPAKWIYLRNKDANLASWYRAFRHTKKNSDTLVVVEDIISAVRLSDYTDSLALLGTDMLRGVIEDIKRHRYKKVWLALDNDAIKKAFHLVRRLSNELPMNVMYLERDIKNMPQDDIAKLMRDYEVI